MVFNERQGWQLRIREQGELWLHHDVRSLFGQDLTFQQLLSDISWRDESIKLFGRWIPVPRRVAYYGDTGTDYRYSGILHSPQTWTATLSNLCHHIRFPNKPK